METNYFEKQNEIDLNNVELNQQTFLLLSNIVEGLCYDHSKKLPKQAEKLEVKKETLEIDLSKLEAARYYQQPKQKQWLDMVGLELKNSLHTFDDNKSKITVQKKVMAIDYVKKIYESNNQELIEKFKEVLEQRYEQAKQKLSVVGEKLKKMITPKDIAMQRGYSNIFTKDKEGFTVPLPKSNSNEKKRELENNPQQSNKRTMLEQNPQSSSNEKSNNGYQNN